MSTLADLQDLDLDLNNIGNWPIIAKAALITIACALVVVGVLYMDTFDQQAALEKTQQTEGVLKNRLKIRAAKASILDKLKAQLDEMRNDFKKLSRQLPNETEVAALLVDISQTGLASGLEFELFQPTAEVPLEFYAELPITLRVTGQYHEFGNFVSGIAALPRIVTLHNFTMKPADNGKLIMEATAKTYRYLDEEEEQGAAK